MKSEEPGSVATRAAPEASPPVPPRCLNCGTALRGEFCHACGQSVRTAIRNFPGVVRDFLDTVFEYAGRLWSTLGPLMIRPGQLSCEYFAGRRVRYVTPFRLFFFITVVAFFAAQLRFDIGDPLQVGVATASGIGAAASVEEVERIRASAVATLEEEMAGDVPNLRAGLGAARAAIDAEADRRIAELRGEAPPAPNPPGRLRGNINFGSEPWDPVTNPVRVGALPDGANQRLNRWLNQADVNQQRIREDPNLLKDAVLSSLPATLFVLVPVFALLLKIAYLFQRRLYMEHLIVAFHSHAFLSATLLLVILLQAVSGLSGGVPALTRSLGLLQVLLVLWVPVYILLLQKRVYQQGWVLTLVKYSALGVSYTVLLSLALTVNLLFNLVAL
jgi:hypothetical protein